MYSTNLTDSQWEGISIFFDLKRKRDYCLRKIMDAIMYMLKSGVQWHLLPNDFPPSGITFYYFNTWKKSGKWQAILLELAKKVRAKLGKNAEPTALIVDSQSVKNSERGVLDKGFDGHKHIQGRKRHLATDSNGFILSCVVGPANRHDSGPGKDLLERVKSLDLPNIKFVIADGAYASLIDLAKEKFGWEIQVSKQIKEKKFIPVAHRWKVERSISWMMWSRRLSKDYELNIDSSEAWVMIHSIKHILKYL